MGWDNFSDFPCCNDLDSFQGKMGITGLGGKKTQK